MRLSLLLTAASGFALAAGGAFAQSTPAQQPRSATELDEVIVTAVPLGRNANDIVSSVAVLGGDELVHRRQATLGETLSGIPGVNSDTFGGGASRPVIRGQTSPRVKVLSNGAALLDASEISPDHAVSVEPLLVDSIEILRGPSALLYGGGAIGGAVNVVDRRIPTHPVEGVTGAVEVRAGTADDERTAVAGVTAGFGAFALRLEALNRESGDYAVPSYQPPHHEHEEGEEEEEHEETGPFDRLAGSFNDTSTVTLGASWVGQRGYLGLAYTEQNSNYGLPGHTHEYESCHPHGSSLHCGGHDHGEDDHDHDHEAGEHAAPVVDLRSKRVDVRGELRQPMAGVERLSLRAGFTDYAHDEKEGDEVATTFTNEGHDVRVELEHAPIGGVRGVVGVQSSRSDFAAIGEEAFMPESVTTSNALFALEEFAVGDVRLELSARQEWQEVEAVGQPTVKHEPFSISGGAVWSFAPEWSVAGSLSRSQRAPSAQELFARGVHLATNTYELGTATLDVETVNAAEVSLRRTRGDTTLTVGVYRYGYDGYIFADTLDQFEDFRLIRYSQADAVFTGVEGEVNHRFTPWLSAAVFGDYVRAKFDNGGGSVPRIPAARLGTRAEFLQGAWSGDVEYQHVFEQDDVAAYETTTPGYDMVNATVAYDFTVGPFGAQVYLRGNNLLDEVALNHASFLADVAPLRGRNLALGIRATF
ncbi:TonB-dependent receptor domain-containing protein [Brevundimonas sp. GCM10030266]|uniref:TonB-dependent receptor domain-containing protein n=1 Tax=Brevundimonas sp. GCM10030266 TaxID=3273386 RepID=UPI003616D570